MPQGQISPEESEAKPKSKIGDVRDLLKNANELAGLVAAVVAAITFASGNRLVSYAFILIACVSIDWFIWRVMRNRRYALAGMLALSLLSVGWVGVNVWNDYRKAQGIVFEPAKPDEWLIIIADFEQRGTKKYDVYDRIRRQLDKAIADAGVRNVRIEKGPTVGVSADANHLGEVHQAAFVIWGWYDDLGFNPSFTVLRSSPKPLAKTEFPEVPAEMREYQLYVRESLPAQLSALATFTVGQLYAFDNRLDEALRAFDVAVANLEQSRRVENAPLPEGVGNLYLVRGNLLYDKSQWDRALADYDQAAALDPRNVIVFNNRGNVYANQSKLDRAIADYSKAIDINPNFVIGLLNRGNALSRQGDLTRALLDYNKAIELDATYVNAFNNRGNAYVELGQLDRALADYDRALQLDPKHTIVYYNRGNALRRKGELDRALADYAKALELGGPDADVYANRGLVYYAQGDLTRALTEYNRALELDPKLVQAYDNRCTLYYDQDDLARALADCSKAIELDPNDDIAYYNRGNIYRLQRDYAKAIADYTRVVELGAANAQTYANRGVCYNAQGDTDRALADYARALEMDPSSASTFYNRGNIYLRKSNWDQAIADYDRAIALDAKFAVAFRNRGLARAQKEDYDGSISDFTQYLLLAPDADDRAEVGEWVRQLKGN